MNLNFEGKRGVEAEINYLASINNRIYNEEVEKKLSDVLMIKFLKNTKNCKDPASFLSWVKKEKPEMLNRLKEEVKNNINTLMEKKVKQNRHIFLHELSEEEQFKIIEKSQSINFDPTDPPTNFSNDLHATIFEKMKIDPSNLEYYPATGSHLDYCGVDAFFKFNYIDKNGNKKFIRVCLDLTTDNELNKNQKLVEKTLAGGKSLSDITLFIKNESYNRKREEDQNMIIKFANQIIEIINQKLKETENEKKIRGERILVG